MQHIWFISLGVLGLKKVKDGWFKDYNVMKWWQLCSFTKKTKTLNRENSDWLAYVTSCPLIFFWLRRQE